MAAENVAELMQAVKTWFYRRQACRRVGDGLTNPGSAVKKSPV